MPMIRAAVSSTGNSCGQQVFQMFHLTSQATEFTTLIVLYKKKELVFNTGHHSQPPDFDNNSNITFLSNEELQRSDFQPLDAIIAKAPGTIRRQHSTPPKPNDHSFAARIGRQIKIYNHHRVVNFSTKYPITRNTSLQIETRVFQFCDGTILPTEYSNLYYRKYSNELSRTTVSEQLITQGIDGAH
ncbi:hypothetical protein CAEBREN_02360 [Caenorhabditis brenneri]|uniref:Uncharacterized protein n=1 Tax=Caenorhabditis brenneri TaxID=135651 RepID=G0P148_CAEBE|nr:hypothetical protein CAEBREN_02360 [Caenorhabditis brenneri]